MRAGSNSLPPDLQKLVRDTAKEVFAEQRKVNRANAAKTLDELKASGVTVLSAQRHAEMARGDSLAVRRVRREEPGDQGDDRQDPRAGQQRLRSG